MDWNISFCSFFIQTSNVYSSMILVQLIGNMLIVAVCTFQCDMVWFQKKVLTSRMHFSYGKWFMYQAFHHIDLQFFLMLGGCAIGLLNLYVYCYYGKMATVELEAYADHIYNTQWYRKRLNIQKSYIVIIQYTQRPVFYHGFDIIDLNMETFSKLIRAVVSYYFMFKTLTMQTWI